MIKCVKTYHKGYGDSENTLRVIQQTWFLAQVIIHPKQICEFWHGFLKQAFETCKLRVLRDLYRNKKLQEGVLVPWIAGSRSRYPP